MVKTEHLFLGAIYAGILYVLFQQQLVDRIGVAALLIVPALIWVFTKKDSIASFFEHGLQSYEFPNVLQEFAKIKAAINSDSSTSYVIDKFTTVLGDPEFSATANQPSLVHYIVSYYDKDDAVPIKRTARVTQSVLHKNKPDAGVIHILPNFVPLEDRVISLSGAKKYPKRGEGVEYYAIRRKPVVTAGSDEAKEQLDDIETDDADEDEE